MFTTHPLSSLLPSLTEYATQATQFPAFSPAERYLVAQANLKLAEADLLADQILTMRRTGPSGVGLGYNHGLSPLPSPLSAFASTTMHSATGFMPSTRYHGAAYGPPPHEPNMSYPRRSYAQPSQANFQHHRGEPQCEVEEILDRIEGYFTGLKEGFRFPAVIDFSPTLTDINEPDDVMSLLAHTPRSESVIMQEHHLHDVLFWISLIDPNTAWEAKRQYLIDEVNTAMNNLYDEIKFKWRKDGPAHLANLQVNTGRQKRTNYDALIRDVGIPKPGPHNSLSRSTVATPSPPSRVGRQDTRIWTLPKVFRARSNASTSSIQGRGETPSSAPDDTTSNDPFIANGPSNDIEQREFDGDTAAIENIPTLTIELAEHFLAYYRRRYEKGPADFKFIEPKLGQGTDWQATMSIGGEAISRGRGSSREEAEVACHLDMVERCVSANPKIWDDFAASDFEDSEADDVF